MRKIKTFILVAIISVIQIGTSHAEIYKWVDAAGNTHYSDKPTASNNSKKIELNVNPAIKHAPTATRSYSNKDSFKVSKTKNKANKKVVMYSTSWCGYCKKARKYFKKNGISFTEYDVEKLPSRMREFKKLGGTGYPLILIGDSKIHGFSQASFESRYKKL